MVGLVDFTADQQQMDTNQQILDELKAIREQNQELLAHLKPVQVELIRSPELKPTPSTVFSSQRIILTTYPGGVGINPTPLAWGHADPLVRGPIVASRHVDSIKRRNCIGAHGGAYSIYRALAVAMNELPSQHRPNLLHTEPVVDFPLMPGWTDPEKVL